MRDEDLPPPPSPETGARFERLVRLIAKLRAPGGCPWDREQTHQTLKPMTLEEAYEVLEAIDAGDPEELRSELGDLLLQVVFHADMAQESGTFDVDGVVAAITDKMVRRHPHVFGEDDASTPAEVLRNWEALKAAERAAKGKDQGPASMLDSVSKAHPALMEAFQMTTKVSRVGFDWPHAEAAMGKLEEELGELRAAARAGAGTKAIEEELGDLIFSAVNVARLLGVDPESALKAANRKFRRRFRHVETRLEERGRKPADSTLDEMDALWEESKRRE
ncbi:MAG: nucleoside triphosphate pyrophosphohydrolase [Vicinamibacteria bacterium]|nr:nucleoside triphosphate pyrophosphohydrolase [Vicinamibacteria bacterium]